MSGGFVATFVRSARIIALSLALVMIPRLALAQSPWEGSGSRRDSARAGC